MKKINLKKLGLLSILVIASMNSFSADFIVGDGVTAIVQTSDSDTIMFFDNATIGSNLNGNGLFEATDSYIKVNGSRGLEIGVNKGIGEFNMTNQTLELTNSSGSVVIGNNEGKGKFNAKNLSITTLNGFGGGYGLNSSANIILDNSTLNTSDFMLGWLRNTEANMNMTNSTISALENFRVGYTGGTGIINAKDSFITTKDFVVSGYNSNSTLYSDFSGGVASVNLENSELSASGRIDIGRGDNANGTLNLSNNSKFITSSLIDLGAGGKGYININNSKLEGSIINMSQYIDVSQSINDLAKWEQGYGEITIKNNSETKLDSINSFGVATLNLGGKETDSPSNIGTFDVKDISLEGTINLNHTGLDLKSNILENEDTTVNSLAGHTEFEGNNKYKGITTIFEDSSINTEVTSGLSPNSDFIINNGALLSFGTVDQTVASLQNDGTFTFNNNSLSMNVAGDYRTNNGVINIYTTLGDDASITNKLEIKGNSSGTGIINVTNDGGTGDYTETGIEIVSVGGTSEATFTLASPVQAGAFEYTLGKNDSKNWYLNSEYIGGTQPGTPPDPDPVDPDPVTPVPIYRPGTSNYINTAMANINGGFATIDAFQNGSQLGGDEVNHYQDSGHNKNLWARTYVLNESLEGKERFEYSQYLGGIQIGQDIYSNDGFEDYKHGGIFVDISEGHLNSYDRFRTLYDTFPSNSTGRTDTLARGIGAYYQYENDKGTYLDTMLLYSLLDNKYTDIYNSKSEQDGKRLSAVIGLGTNLFESNVRNWNIQLNSQLGYLKTNMNEFQDDISTIKSYSSNALRAKLGLKAYINLPETNPNSQFHNTMLYATTNIVQDLTSLKGIEVGNVTVNEKYSKTVVEAGLGIRTQARQNTEFYADIKGFSNLDSLKKTGFTGVAGVKFTW